MTNLRQTLSQANLRPTRQRLLIAEYLFNGPDRHFTAEDLHLELSRRNEGVALATIYNTLGAFTEAGLLGTVSVDAGRVFYDTNTRPHHHLYDADHGALTDVETVNIKIEGLPDLPEGQVLDRVDVIIRTRPAK